MKRKRSAARLFLGAVVATAAATTATSQALAAAPQQLTAEGAALLKLDAGRRAFNEKNYQLAAAGFKDFLANNSGHQEAAGAWYGLGLCILQTPHPDFNAAVDAFNHSVAAPDFPDRPLALYYLGSSLRGLGNRAMADASARPNDADTLKKLATEKYTAAAAQFAAAQAAFDKRVVESPPAAPAALSADIEWSARSRCDLAEVLLRLGKYKEALDASSPFQADRILVRSRYRQLGLYHLGYAQFVLGDYPLSIGPRASSFRGTSGSRRPVQNRTRGF